MALLAALAAFSLSVIAALGYTGVFLLMTGESMVLPIPSEAVLPFAGYLAWQGGYSFAGMLLASIGGTIVGSRLSYAMGVYGLRPLLERYGKYVFVTPHHVELAHAFFERRGGALGIFLSRFVPIVRHLISIPAGSARMPLVPFVLATLAGGGLWDLTLLYAGYSFGKNYDQVTTFVDDYKWYALGLAVLIAFAVIVVAVRRKKATPG